MKVVTAEPHGWRALLIFVAGAAGSGLGAALYDAKGWTDSFSLTVSMFAGLLAPTAALYKLFEVVNERRHLRDGQRATARETE